MSKCLLMCAALMASAVLPAVEYIWVEGENPSAGGTGLAVNHVYDSPNPILSGGSSFGGGGNDKLFIEYDIDAPSAGEYSAYVRRFWNHGHFRWKIGNSEWKELKQGTILENLPLQHHCISWLPMDRVTLVKGKQTLRIEALKDGPFVIDCFVFSKTPFEPTGTLRPGDKYNKAEPGTWAFEPDSDDYRPDALNLRALNEKVAGSRGQIKIDSKGDFIDGAGKPIRFWAAVSWIVDRPGTTDLQAHAKHLAKRGVNMIRHFGALNPTGTGRGPTPREGDIDEAQKAVAIFKREGIYTTIEPYWAGFSEAPPQTYLFWDESLQSDYKSWVKELLTRPNPYDEKKTPLGKDPALAIFQIQNEDSLFFWTSGAVLKGEPLNKITALYHAWRAKNKLTGTPALNLKFWEVSNPNQDIKESMRFLAETQRTWHEEIERFIREECGCKALINSGNWRTADQLRLLDLDRWSCDANEVIANNKYMSNVHVNPKDANKSGYLVEVGDLFTDSSKLTNWDSLVVCAKQVAGKAYIVPESTWVPPGSFASEGPFLVAAYSSLIGMDGYYWFSLGSTGYDRTLNKWQAASPSIMGGWPAASVLFRNGLVARGATVVHEERPMEDLWNLRPPLLSEESGYDPNRDTQINPLSNVKTTVDPAAYLVGPVEVKYGGDPAKSKVMDIKPFVDKEKGTITSNTMELILDSKNGLCTLNAPAAQGATGFLAKAGKIALKDFTIESKNDYATVFAVAMDSLPLNKSKKVLLQVTTQHRQYGWRQSPAAVTFQKKTYDGFRIDSLGELPWNVVDTDMTLSLFNGGLKKVTRLDENLYPTPDVVSFQRSGNVLNIKPSKNTMYLLVE